jgi:5'-nucleotidase
MNNIGRLLCFSALAGAAFCGAWAENLVILHTNDTHSTIDPDANGRGGVLQRKAIIDSVRSAEKNVILVDAGDVVQGTLYFREFKGDVEYPLMEKLGYDIRVLGNHEFDNGINDLAKYYKNLKGKAISANYDFSGTPLDGVFLPYVVKTVDGKRIGFFGLNVDPYSLIDDRNMGGIRFKDVISTANATAAKLRKQEKCDLVVAVTHIGYTTKQEKTTDVDLAKASRDIDVIIGGHSHTVVCPGNADSETPCYVDNAAGRPVLIAQTGKYGPYLGYINIDLDKVKRGKTDVRGFDYRLIPVTDRFAPETLDADIREFIRPYKAVVDSINGNVIGYAPRFMDSDDRVGEYANWTGDYARNLVQLTLDSLNAAHPGSVPASVDLGLMNVGGIRLDMPKGYVTEGQILSTFPFANKFVVLRLKGSDLLSTLAIAAKRKGECVSENVRVVVDKDWNMVNALINGSPIDSERVYNVATIDYLARGNDSLVPLKNGTVAWTDERDIALPTIEYVKRNTSFGLPMWSDPSPRFVECVEVMKK